MTIPRAKHRRRPKIFIGLGEVAGFFGKLNSGFQSLGLESYLLDLDRSPFSYAQDLRRPSVNLCRKAKWKTAHAKGRMARLTWLMTFRMTKIYIFLWAFARFDVFIFTTFCTFFGFKELPILKFFKKKIIYVFVGTDIRPSYLSGNEIIRLKRQFGDDYLPALRESSREKKRKIAVVERHADFIVSYPPFAQLQTRDFISHAVTGFPMEAEIASGSIQNQETDRAGVRILHAPSFPEAKGSVAIKEMVDRISAKIEGLTFREISYVPNEIVLQEIQQSDFIVDEVYSDAPMGGLAAEAALYGKPAVVGGYYAASYRKDIPPDDVPPSQFCLPEDMEAAITELAADASRRKELGRRARAFIQDLWDAPKVAGRYLALIEGNFPQDWFFPTASLDYFLGYGISRDNLRKLLSEYIAAFGREALFLADKPDLERKILEFAGAC
jgi:glycosyltransferase involved in cell wall biosynthesis